MGIHSWGEDDTNIARMCRKYWLIAVLFPVALLAGAASVTAQIADQTHGWYNYFGNHRISERWGLHTEYQWRRHGLVNEWQQSLMRVGVDHHMTNGAIVTAGYAWIRTFPYGEMPFAYEFDEHRIWQQLVMGQKLGRFNFQHRYRLEQRFMERKTPDGDGEGFQHLDYIFRQRIRYRLLITIPLMGPELKNNSLFLAVSGEPFIQFGRNLGLNVLDQNRLYAGLGWRFDKRRNIQIGYMNQYWFKADGVRAERNHTLQVAVTWDLDLRKPAEAAP
jgi:hypothetical protein